MQTEDKGIWHTGQVWLSATDLILACHTQARHDEQEYQIILNSHKAWSRSGQIWKDARPHARTYHRQNCARRKRSRQKLKKIVFSGVMFFWAGWGKGVIHFYSFYKITFLFFMNRWMCLKLLLRCLERISCYNGRFGLEVHTFMPIRSYVCELQNLLLPVYDFQCVVST